MMKPPPTPMMAASSPLIAQRMYGARTDAYRVFARMLDSGNPPDAWGDLVKAAEDPATARRLAGVIERAGSLA